MVQLHGPSATRSSSRDRLILNFHGIGEPWDGVPEDEQRYWCPLPTWHALATSLAELARTDDIDLEITFDDGNLSDIEYAMPTLLDQGLEATFHVCADRIGKSHYVGDKEIRTLRDAGMRIGSHGWGHIDLRRANDQELTRETHDARRRIATACGGEITQFAIPFGSYDRHVLRSLRHYSTVYTSDQLRSNRGDWLAPRMSYNDSWPPDAIIRFAREPGAWITTASRRAKMILKQLR